MGTPAARLSEAQRDDLDRLNLALAEADILPCGDDDRAISEDPRVQALAAPACQRRQPSPVWERHVTAIEGATDAA